MASARPSQPPTLSKDSARHSQLEGNLRFDQESNSSIMARPAKGGIRLPVETEKLEVNVLVTLEDLAGAHLAVKHPDPTDPNYRAAFAHSARSRLPVTCPSSWLLPLKGMQLSLLRLDPMKDTGHVVLWQRNANCRFSCACKHRNA